MPVLYRYTAKNMEGKSVRGTAEAEDYDALYAQLLGQGLYLQSASKGFGGGGKALKSRQLADFCRELSTLLAAGVSLVRALTIISEQEGLNAAEKRLYASILAEVRKGANLSSALEAQGVFPPLCLGMVRAGEGSGQLDRVTDRLARHYDSEHRLNQQLKSALTYPIILGILAVAVVIILVTFVLPQFNDLFANMDSLPATTLALMAASDFMTTRWYVVVMAVVVLVIAVQALLRVAEVKFAVDKMALTMPVFGRLNSVICTARSAACIRPACPSCRRSPLHAAPSATSTSTRSSTLCSPRSVRARTSRTRSTRWMASCANSSAPSASARRPASSTPCSTRLRTRWTTMHARQASA